MMRSVYIQIQNKPLIDISNMGVFTIGRKGDIEINDTTISRIHCTFDTRTIPTLLIDGDTIKGSKNGTYVNGVKYSGNQSDESNRSVFLKHNDIIQIGGCVIRYLLFDNKEGENDIHATT